MNKQFKTKVETRLPSNLRPTTRECVHLVMHGHFSHVTKMAVTPFNLPKPKKQMKHALQTSWLNLL